MKYYLLAFFLFAPLLISAQKLDSTYLNKKIDSLNTSNLNRIDTLNYQLNELKEKIIKQQNPPFNTYISFIVSALAFLSTLVIASLSYLSFKQYNKTKKRVNNKLKSFDEKMTILAPLQKEISGSQTYIKHGIDYSFQSLYLIVNSIQDEKKAKLILASICMYQNVTNLYSVDEMVRYSGLTYLKELGNKEVLTHLDYVARNDTNFENKFMAASIIGIINEREYQKNKEEESGAMSQVEQSDGEFNI
jgi:hypothetical protein